MELLIAIELIFAVTCVVAFWCTNLELQLARRSRDRVMDPDDDATMIRGDGSTTISRR